MGQRIGNRHALQSAAALTRVGLDATPLAAAARDTLQAATAQRRALLDELFTTAAAGLPPQEAAVLAAIRDNRDAGWDLPTPYLAAERPDPAWVALKDALATQRIHAEHGLPEHPDAHQLLLTEHSNPSVATAHTNLNTHHVETQNAWTQSTAR